MRQAILLLERQPWTLTEWGCIKSVAAHKAGLVEGRRCGRQLTVKTPGQGRDDKDEPDHVSAEGAQPMCDCETR